jgi:hypothetical protein
MSTDRRGVLLATAIAAAIGVGGATSESTQAPSGAVGLSANPERVCLDPRPAPHLNFDLVIRNGTTRELKVRELRAVVLDAKDEVVERRLVWQDALSVLGPSKTVAPGAEGLLFNPFTFHSVKAGSRIRYEIDFEGESASASVVVRPVSCVTHARLVLPLTGRVLVYDGYDFLSHHRRQSEYLRPQMKAFGVVDNWFRFGLDLVPTDAEGRFFRSDGSRREDWYGWGAPVRAAGAGVVVAARDDRPDNDQVGSENRWVPKRLSEDEMNAEGNYVLIDHGGGEFSLFSHLKQGSVRVKKGDRVRADQVVAQVGDSGSSLIPHLHYDLRTAPGWGVRGVRALPPYFHDLTVLGTGEGADGRAVPVNTGDVLIAR